MGSKKLELWQGRLSRGQTAYDAEHVDFEKMHILYTGDYDAVTGMFDGDHVKRTPVLRNIIQEIIEAEASTAIPMPKVTAMRKEDEDKARLIEDMIRDRLNGINMEMLNDVIQRMVPVYGAAVWMCEWDNAIRTHGTVGDVSVRVLHPKQLVPQPGITEGVPGMDWCILKLPMTRAKVKSLYKIDIADEGETEPELRSGDGAAQEADDMLTVYHGYYRTENGGIGLYVWCGDTELADFADYQARRVRKCRKCGAADDGTEPIGVQTEDGGYPLTGEEIAERASGDAEEPEAQKKRKPGSCPYCGADDWTDEEAEFEDIAVPPMRSDGTPAVEMVQETYQTGQTDAYGEPVLSVRYRPVRIPYYKPDVYPFEIQRNTSVYGKLLGESDADKIKTQQNAVNRIEAKIAEKALTGGSYRTVPADCSVRIDSTEGRRYIVDDPSKMSMFQKIDMEFNVEQELALEEHWYQEARQIIGITDSFQGRTDKTAQSGKAKEFAAAQSAGRLESRRKNAEAALQVLYEMIFKFTLAYADEPRWVRKLNDRGEAEYEQFTRWDFLERDDAGEYIWNDRFLFSCDTATPLANNREAMWQETRENFSAGAFGDPANPDTLIMFWQKMELLHYPGAAETKRYLEEQKQAAMEAQAAAEEQARADAQRAAEEEAAGADMERRDAAAQQQMQIIEQARRDAQNAAQSAAQNAAQNAAQSTVAGTV